MNIIQIGPRISTLSNGVGVAVDGLCNSLVSQGHTVELHLIEPILPEIKQRQYSIYSYKPSKIFQKFGYSHNILTCLQNRISQCNIIHNNSLWMYINLVPAKIKIPNTCKMIISPHGTLSETALKRSSLLKNILLYYGQMKSLKLAAAFHATSQAELYAIRSFGIKKPIALIPHGVMCRMLGSKVKKKKRILYLGRIHPIKGLVNLVKAWKLLHEYFPDWELVIAGPNENNYQNSLEKIAQEHKIERIFFQQPVYGDTKDALYRSSSLFVLPSMTENFGYSVAEALSYGIPVIASTGTPWRSLHDKQCGWWVENSIESLAHTLQQALSCSLNELTQMGNRGKIWIDQDYSWKAIGDKMDEFYTWTLGKTSKPDFVSVT